jgi:hypothetical protein
MDGDHEFAHLTEKLIGAKPDMKSDQKTNVNATEKAE